MYPIPALRLPDGITRLFNWARSKHFNLVLLVEKSNVPLLSLLNDGGVKGTWLLEGSTFSIQLPYHLVVLGPLTRITTGVCSQVEVADVVEVLSPEFDSLLTPPPKCLYPVVAYVPVGCPLITVEKENGKIKYWPPRSSLDGPRVLPLKIFCELYGWTVPDFKRHVSTISRRFETSSLNVAYHIFLVDKTTPLPIELGRYGKDGELKYAILVSVTRMKFSAREFSYGTVYSEYWQWRPKDGHHLYGLVCGSRKRQVSSQVTIAKTTAWDGTIPSLGSREAILEWLKGITLDPMRSLSFSLLEVSKIDAEEFASFIYENPYLAKHEPRLLELLPKLLLFLAAHAKLAQAAALTASAGATAGEYREDVEMGITWGLS